MSYTRQGDIISQFTFEGIEYPTTRNGAGKHDRRCATRDIEGEGEIERLLVLARNARVPRSEGAAELQFALDRPTPCSSFFGGTPKIPDDGYHCQRRKQAVDS